MTSRMTPRVYVLPVILIAVLALVGCDDTTARPSETATRATDKTAPTQPEEHAGEQARHEAAGQGHAEQGAEHGEDEEEGTPGRVHLTEDQLGRLDIQVAEAQSGSATAMVTAPATVAFDSDRVARIGPRLSAKVVEVTADLGERVEAGDTVAILDSVALGQAKADYLTAAARYRTELAEYQRNQSLAEDKIISEAALLESRARYLQARAERNAARAELKLYGMSETAIESINTEDDAPLSRYRLTTPMAGIVQRRDLVPGETISASETPIHVVDNSRMWVMISADEQTLPRLKPGLPVALQVRPLPERTFTGEIGWISAELDEQTRTVRVRATVENRDNLLKAGMFGRARIKTESERNFALVPVGAVQGVDEQDVVFVPGDEPGAFRAVPVVLGAESGGQVEIREGLTPSDAVVVTGAFDLASALTAGGRSASHSH